MARALGGVPCPQCVVVALVVGVVVAVLGRAPGLWRKSQPVRLVDVFLLGPFMVWAGIQGKLPRPARFVLIAAGAATVVFNGLNWLQIRASANPGA